nr:unnamed protein product [Spirometra erinaceieuropaei]
MTPVLQTYIPRANRPRRTPSETMNQQHGKAKFFSHERPYYHPCCKPRDDDHPVIGGQTADAPPPSISALLQAMRRPQRPAPSTPRPLARPSSTGPHPTSCHLLPSASTLRTSSDVDSVPACPHRDRTFNSYIGLVDHL